MALKIVVAMLSHETNTFSRIRTGLEQFREREVHFGKDVIKAHQGKKTGIGGFLDALRDVDAEFVPTISAEAMPSGIVERLTYEHFRSEHLRRIRKAGGVDGALLALHGSMVVDGIPDGDGDFLRSTREAIGPQTPIMNTFDFHSTLTELKVQNSNGIFGYDTNPHIDLYERGSEAAVALLKTLRAEIRPTMALVKPRMLVPGVNASTWSPTGRNLPFARLFKVAKEEEAKPGVINVSISGGFPFSDVKDSGMGAVAITNGDQSLAREIAERIGQMAWNMRSEFLKTLTPIDDAVRQGMEAKEGPVILVDVADDPGAGAPGDGPALLKAMIRAKTDNAAFAVIHDPQTVKGSIRKGVGNCLNVTLGGKKDPRCGKPARAKARVKLIFDGRFVETGPMGRGRIADIGPTVVLQIGGIDVIVTSKKTAPNDVEIFRSVGIEPMRKKILVLKSTQHYRASYEPIAKRIIEVDTPGIGTANLHRLRYRYVRRPIFPLDSLNDWR